MTTCLHPNYDDTPQARRLRAWHLVEAWDISLYRDGIEWIATVEVEGAIYHATDICPIDAIERAADIAMMLAPKKGH